MRPLLALLGVLSLVPACHSPACAAPQAPDQPVAASEPRATLKVRLDLERRGGCDESFDLALYRDRGIDLVTWEGTPGKCNDRTATIRYLPKRINRNAVLDAVKKLSLKAEVIEG